MLQALVNRWSAKDTDEGLTLDVLVKQVRELVKEQALYVHLSQSLLQRSRAMCNDGHYFFHEDLVRGNLGVPGLHKVSKHYRNNRIELQIDIVPARQGREQLVEGRRSGPASVAHLLRA